MLDQLCDRLFEVCSGSDAVQGRLIWCPVGNVEEVPRVLDVERSSPTDHYATKFDIVQLDGDRHFRTKTKLPMKAMSLADTEELLISKAKKRPCFVLSAANTDFSDHASHPATAKKRHLWNGAVLLAPLYGLATLGDTAGFPPVMVARIKAMLYNQFMHVPRECPKTKLTIGKESVVRLDRIFSAVPTARAVHMDDIRLAEEPLSLLLALARERLAGGVDAQLETMREILKETLPDEAVPA